jgi:hypothetical protein
MTSTKIGDLRTRLENARSALLEGRWDAAVDELRECEDWPVDLAEHAVLVKADALLRRDVTAALTWLIATDDIVATDGGRFARELLTGRALGIVRNYDGANARFERARALLDRVPGGAPKLAFHTARLRWFRREAQPDDPDVTLALTDPDPTGRASAYSVRSWTYAATGAYGKQLDDLVTAVEIFAAEGYRCDVGAMGIIVHTLARLAFEIADPHGMRVARAAYESIRWTEGVAEYRFQTLRSLGLDAFMHGDVARAQWLFRDATAVAPTPAYQLLGHLDRAYVARIMRNEPWALDELHEAVRIAHGVPWGQSHGEERVALVVLAVLLAPTNAAEAQRFAAIYSMLGVESVSPLLALSQERRAVAAEKYALGRIEQTLGHTDTACAVLQEAYDVYAPIDHHYQAMLVASTLAEMTGLTVWSERARAHAEHYPGCPMLARELDDGTRSDPALEDLSPLQRQLARAHWAGADAHELSRRYSRSLFTIQRHLQEIYRVFGVDSGESLRAEAMRRSLA